MKARQIQSRFWDDSVVQNATWQSKYIFIYLLTCSPINMCGIFQLTEKKIIFETGLSEGDLTIAKEELSAAKKVFLFEGWVFVVNAFKNCKVWKSEKCWDAWEEDFSKISDEILAHFNTAIGIDIYSAQKTEINKQKQLTKEKKEDKEKKEYEKKTGRMMSPQESGQLAKEMAEIF